MYTYTENLRRLDQVVVTNREFDKVLVWKENIFKGKFKRLKQFKPEVEKKPPAPPKNDEEEKKQSNQWREWQNGAMKAHPVWKLG